MKTAWDNVSAVLDEMRFLLVEAGIPAAQVQMPQGKEPDEIKIPQYVKAFDWLHNLKMSQEWEVLASAKALLPQSAWDNYKALQMRGLREQVILESAQLGVRKLWKDKRPSFFGRIYKEPKQKDETAELQKLIDDYKKSHPEPETNNAT